MLTTPYNKHPEILCKQISTCLCWNIKGRHVSRSFISILFSRQPSFLSGPSHHYGVVIEPDLVWSIQFIVTQMVTIGSHQLKGICNEMHVLVTTIFCSCNLSGFVANTRTCIPTILNVNIKLFLCKYTASLTKKGRRWLPQNEDEVQTGSTKPIR